MSESSPKPEVGLAKNDEMLPGVTRYLEQLGVNTGDFPEEERGRSYTVDRPEARYSFLNASDVAGCYMDGILDAGMTGSDWAFEWALRKGKTLQDVKWMPAYILDGEGGKESFGDVRRVLASPDGNLSQEPYVAAEKPDSARFFLEDSYPGSDVKAINGSSEVFPKYDGVDAYFGIVESGNTMKQNGMEPVEHYEKSTGVWLGQNPWDLFGTNL
jgi:ATP phosphoribosyltransferase|nr:MAG: ATP phosphoribosyltransferase [Candidatus Nanosalinarum sp. J07AB56]